MIYTQKTITMDAADDNGISTAQTPGAAGDLTITGALATGGVATLDIPRRVAIYSASNISNRTFTVYGTDRDGQTISEGSITGPNNSTVYTAYDFKTVTRIAISGAAAGALIAGTNGVASTAWIPTNVNYSEFQCSLAVVLTAGASLSYTVQHTFQDTQVSTNIAAIYVFPHDDSDLVAATASADGNYAFPPKATRLTLVSFTSGTAQFTVIQPGA